MTTGKQDEVQKWLHKSRQDVGAARRLLEGEPPYRDAAVFHCQQAAEKAVKAYLTYHDIAFPRTHDLTELLAWATTRHAPFEEWQRVAQELTPYAVLFRYPGDVLEPSRDEAAQALRDAVAFVDFVLSILPDEVRS